MTEAATIETTSQQMPQLVTVREAAALLRVAPITVRRMLGRGELPSRRVGRGVRIRIADLEAFVEACPSV